MKYIHPVIVDWRYPYIKLSEIRWYERSFGHVEVYLPTLEMARLARTREGRKWPPAFRNSPKILLAGRHMEAFLKSVKEIEEV